MARTGSFGGFVFDPEVFADYMREQNPWRDEIMASGILQSDPTIMQLIGEKGNVATLPFYKPVDIATYAPLNNDGTTDNTPEATTGGKQTAMLIQRMKAFKAADFTRELTGADPMTNIRNSIVGYYSMVWQYELLNTAKAIMGVEALNGHVTDIAEDTGTGEVTDANKIDAKTLIYAEQKALGDSATGFGLLVMPSMIYAKYKEMGLVDFNKYTVSDAIRREVELPTIGGKIPLITDNSFTVDATQTNVKYNTFLFGQGAFLTAEKTNYKEPYYTDYDPEKQAGIESLYTKQGKVLHPNGVSIKADNITAESPTSTELGTAANWELKYDQKNVRIGVITSNG